MPSCLNFIFIAIGLLEVCNQAAKSSNTWNHTLASPPGFIVYLKVFPTFFKWFHFCCLTKSPSVSVISLVLKMVLCSLNEPLIGFYLKFSSPANWISGFRRVVAARGAWKSPHWGLFVPLCLKFVLNTVFFILKRPAAWLKAQVHLILTESSLVKGTNYPNLTN